MVPPDAIKKLQILRNLYYGPEDKETEVEKRKYGLDPFEEPDDDIDLIDPSGQEEEEEEEEVEEDEDDEEEEWVPPAKRRKTATPRRQADAIFNYRKWGWDFGPESSSDDKRKRSGFVQAIRRTFAKGRFCSHISTRGDSMNKPRYSMKLTI